jgi:hypothetical protein
MVDDEPPSLTLTPQLSQVATVAANLASALYYLRAVREDTRVQALRSERRQVHGERRQVHRAGARAGHDPAAVLAHLAKVRGFDDAASVAQVLHWRIGRFIDGDTRFRGGFAADQPAGPAGPARPGAPTSPASPAAPASVVLQRVGRPAADDDGIVEAELVDDGAGRTRLR